MAPRVLVATVAGGVGLVIGFFSAVWVFAIDIDLMAVPYANQPVKTTRQVLLVQDSLSVVLPKGAKIIHKYSPDGVPIYSLEFISNLGDRPIVTPSPQKDYFYVRQAR